MEGRPSAWRRDGCRLSPDPTLVGHLVLVAVPPLARDRKWAARRPSQRQPSTRPRSGDAACAGSPGRPESTAGWTRQPARCRSSTRRVGVDRTASRLLRRGTCSATGETAAYRRGQVLAGGHVGGLTAQRVELDRVVGAVLGLDSVGVNRLPLEPLPPWATPRLRMANESHTTSVGQPM